MSTFLNDFLYIGSTTKVAPEPLMRLQRGFFWSRLMQWAMGLAGIAIMAPAGGALAEPPMLTTPEPPRGPITPGLLRVTSPVGASGSVYLRWTGSIAPPMAEKIESAFNAFKASRTRFVLVMNSSGGNVREGELVIALLKRIRRTHRLDSVVERGGTCGSMCVPIYLQGDARYAARASTWLFHEITRLPQPGAKLKRVKGAYSTQMERHWVPAGVSRTWIDKMLPLADGHDYWQTGNELIADNAGIINRPLENRLRRNLADEDGSSSATSAAAPANVDAQSKPGQLLRPQGSSR